MCNQNESTVIAWEKGTGTKQVKDFDLTKYVNQISLTTDKSKTLSQGNIWILRKQNSLPLGTSH